VKSILASGVSEADVSEQLISEHLSSNGVPDLDLIIRTSGEWRLSNFMIWEAAYSEYWPTQVYWPDFTPQLLQQAIDDYGKRDRRYGGIGSKA
jgi:undecaprenyl diphosphate synthase